MKSLKITFNESGAIIELDQTVEALGAEVQNGLVNVATSMGSDKIYPDRGTNLLAEATKGAIIDINSARHSANFAALNTTLFIRNTLPASMTNSNDRIIRMKLSTTEFDGLKLNLQAQFTTADERTVGIDTDITTATA